MGIPRTSIWRRLWLKIADWLLPTERLKTTLEGLGYWISWFALAVIGWYQQINLILLISGLVAGPLVASFFMSTAMLRKVKLQRRLPTHIFAGDPLSIDYILDNTSRSSAVLALCLEDHWAPVESVLGSISFEPKVFYSRVAVQHQLRSKFQPNSIYKSLHF